MELREFISQTLVDIQGGVNDAIHKAKAGEIPGAINPVWGGAKEAGREDIQVVSFDIAVAVSESTDSGVKGGIKVMGIGVDGDTTEFKENSHTSRIQFTVPVLLPVHSLMLGNA
ncbi:hypothetical protein [Alcanivorax sp.]|uniref:hypothetical protein n=1 Tax=Alcanivorax sp. TaxID=1872427 RepID=UPI000C1191F8|nr:hypothetical protein [Alcanivorax sp.]PHR68282.1 MAG: hypothetical protein COA55_01460 [Alcanivorax sp.]